MNSNAPVRLSAGQTAEYLRLSRSTLAKWRMRGEGPAYHRCGPRIVYYLKQEIDAWLAQCDSQIPTRPTQNT